ncbi:hypothetical protein DSUL_20466 [Desulfovibrionales bacterium]
MPPNHVNRVISKEYDKRPTRRPVISHNEDATDRKRYSISMTRTI